MSWLRDDRRQGATRHRYGQLADVMGMPHFISILDAFHGERRVAVAERLLRAVCKSDTRATIQDPVVLHFIFEQVRGWPHRTSNHTRHCGGRAGDCFALVALPRSPSGSL